MFRTRTPAAVGAAWTIAGAVGLSLMVAAPAAAEIRNPIIGDGSVYSADPATLVVDDTLYVYAGRDEAGPAVNDFIMNEWQAFSTTDVAGGEWEHHPSLMRPEDVFAWATPGRAYAGQVVEGGDGRFYWFVPVHEAGSASPDPFGIGVAVSDSPLGPWTDHVGAPIVSQEILGNDAHNIDPTVLVDDDGRVWMYWGSFGRLMAVELSSDMTTLVGSARTITAGVTGFFEAAWLFERDDTYYLAYAANNAGPTSTCTPANYHACIAYSTASSPLGPWTFQGRILAPVSSTTSHPAITRFGDEWYMAYHTADAAGGNHFRRSVAVDRLEWDDSVSPARILPVTTTPDRGIDLTPRANVAPWATVTVSNEPVPVQYWTKALNDEIIRPNPLPPDMWGSWTASRPPQEWLQYEWEHPVRVDSAAIQFWNDAAAGSGNGVAAPASWRLQYWEQGRWIDVPDASGYPTETRRRHVVTFDAVTTTRMRAVLDASPNAAVPPLYSALAVEEWEVHAAQPDGYAPVATSTLVGALPDLPETVALTYGDEAVAAPVRWDAVDAAQVASAGSFTVGGFAEGYAAGRVEATVAVLAEAPWRADHSAAGTPVAQYTAPWNRLAALNDGVVAATGDPQDRVWATWSADRPAERWVGYTWDEPMRIDAVAAHFWSDVAGAGNGDGVALPAAWRVQVPEGSGWRDIEATDGYPISATGASRATFEPVETSAVRIVMTAQTDGVTFAAVGLSELQVRGESPDTSAPELALSARGAEGRDGWYVGPVTVRATAVDDRDTRPSIEMSLDGGDPVSTPGTRYAETLVTTDGSHLVTARATDAAGNASALVEREVRIDATAPRVSGAADEAGRTVTATASDDGSGVVGIEYAVDDVAGWTPYTAPVSVDQERHVVYLRASDAAGTTSDPIAVTVARSPDAPLVGNIAPLARVTASFTSGWNSVDAVIDGSSTGASWGTWPRVGEQWVQLDWDRQVRIDRLGALFFRDQPDGANAGMIPPRSWVAQYRAADGSWVDVPTADAYARSSDEMNEVSFPAVETSAVRVLLQSWGAQESGGSSGIWEIEAFAAPVPADTTAPEVSLAPVAAAPASGWYREAVAVTVTAVDDTDAAPRVRVRIDGGAWSERVDEWRATGDGTHLVEAEAWDAAGNVSARATLTVRIDGTPPAASAVVETHADGARVSISASDAQSGVAAIEYRLGDGEWSRVAGGGVDLERQGAVEVAYRAVDVAGNVSAAQTLRVETGDPASPPTPAVSLAAAQVSAGGSLALRGSGFAPGERVRVTLFSEPVVLAVLTADAAGEVAAVVGIPAATPPGAHEVELRGLDSERAARAAVEVLATVPPPAAPGAAALPATGADPAPAIWLSVAALLAGASALGVRRIRRRAD